MAGGPRDYTTGTERALFRLAKGTCYSPGCLEPVMRTVAGHPVIIAEIGHIRGANKGSPRYDESMTDEQRASFANLILVCTAHHKIIDRLDADNYPPEMLESWKADAEVEGGLEALAAMDGRLDSNHLAELLEEAVRHLGPSREVAVELDCGIIIPGIDIAAISPSVFGDVLRANPKWARMPRVLVTMIRNTGFTDVTVEQHTLYYSLRLPGGAQGPLAFLGQNRMPALNPVLPKRLLAGEATQWFTPYATLADVASSGVCEVAGMYATTPLGSGETVTSAEVPWPLLCIQSGAAGA